MRTQTILGCLVASISLLSWCHDGLAQNSDSGADLQSVLKPAASTDDLRLLIDLDVPVADPIEPTDSAAATSTKATAEQIATPAPIDRATKPAPAATSTQPSPIKAKPNSASAITAAAKIPDPIFDLGLIIKDDVANSTPIVRGVLVGSPAAMAGVRSGDKIRAVGKHQTRSSYGLSAELITTNTSKFDLTVERGSEIRVLKVDKAAKPSIATASARKTIANSRAVAPAIPQPIASPTPKVTSAPQAVVPATNLVSPVTSPNSVMRTRANGTPVVTSNPAPPAPIPVRQQVQARPAAYAAPSVATTPPASTQRPRSTSSSLVPPPRPRPISPQTTRYQPTPTAIRNPVARNPATVVTQPAARPATSVVQRQTFPSSARTPVVVQQRVVRAVPQPRTLTPQAVRPQPVIVRGQGPVPTQGRPFVGDGGRLIGNGRIINSTLRLLGR